MATGLEMYDALYRATRRLTYGAHFTVNSIEAIDLQRLEAADLVARGYNQETAKNVSAALLSGDLGPLGDRLGLLLAASQDAPRLLQG
jgi:hypothetical protein